MLKASTIKEYEISTKLFGFVQRQKLHRQSCQSCCKVRITPKLLIKPPKTTEISVHITLGKEVANIRKDSYGIVAVVLMVYVAVETLLSLVVVLTAMLDIPNIKRKFNLNWSRKY